MDVQFLNRRKISHFTVVNLAAILIERTSVLQLTLAGARVNFQMIFLSIACRKLVSKFSYLFWVHQPECVSLARSPLLCFRSALIFDDRHSAKSLIPLQG